MIGAKTTALWHSLLRRGRFWPTVVTLAHWHERPLKPSSRLYVSVMPDTVVCTHWVQPQEKMAMICCLPAAQHLGCAAGSYAALQILLSSPAASSKLHIRHPRSKRKPPDLMRADPHDLCRTSGSPGNDSQLISSKATMAPFGIRDIQMTSSSLNLRHKQAE